MECYGVLSLGSPLFPNGREQLWAERVVVGGSVGIHCVQGTRSAGRCFEVKTDFLPIGPSAAYKGAGAAALQPNSAAAASPFSCLIAQHRGLGGGSSLLDAQRPGPWKTTDQFVEAKFARTAPG